MLILHRYSSMDGKDREVCVEDLYTVKFQRLVPVVTDSGNKMSGGGFDCLSYIGGKVLELLLGRGCYLATFPNPKQYLCQMTFEKEEQELG